MADLDPLRRFPTLVTDRLILRDTTMMDAAQVSKILSDPCVSEYYGVDHVTDLERSREIISLRQERFQRGEAIRWAIALAENNLYLGSVEIRNKPGDPGCAELGYELSPEFWGQGFMNEALSEAIRYIFSKTKIVRLEARIRPENDRSLRLVEKLGFEREGLLRKAGCWRGERYDMLIFSLIAPEQ